MLPQFLIVTNKSDITSDYIVREFKSRNLPFIRLNAEDVEKLSVTFRVGPGTVFEFDGRICDLGAIKSAYFRRPLPPEINKNGGKPSSHLYISEEWSYFLRSMYLEIGSRWFNHPNSIVLAEDKPRQLRLAQDVGFNIPDTVITNDVDKLRELFSTGEVVAKPMKQSLLEEGEGPGGVIFTSEISSFEDVGRDRLRSVPVIFQRKIPKAFELRITVVQDKVFSVQILSQEFEKTRVDWRHSAIVDLEHRTFDLDERVAEQCREIVSRLHLRFGAIDLVVDPNGKIWFLECNPNGQWAWIENRTGLPIAASIVDSMVKMS